MHVVLVSCVGKAGKPNITTLAWAMPTSINPPLVAISLAPTRHTHTLIEESGDFVINIPTLETLQAVYACGSLTGRSFDKFKKTNLTPMPAKKVKAPAIRECIAHVGMHRGGQIHNWRPHGFRGQNTLKPTLTWVYSPKAMISKRHACSIHLGGNNFALLDPKIYKA